MFRGRTGYTMDVEARMGKADEACGFRRLGWTMRNAIVGADCCST